MSSFFDKYINSVKDVDTIHYTGLVTAVKGNLIESKGPQCVIGEICTIKIPKTDISDTFRADLENSDAEKYISRGLWLKWNNCSTYGLWRYKGY